MDISDEKQTFWDHLDILRASLIKIVVVTLVFGIVAFFFKEELFAIVLAPKNPTSSRTVCSPE